MPGPNYRARILKAFLGGNYLELSGPRRGSLSIGTALNNSRYELGMQAIHISDLAYLVSRRHLSAFWTKETHILQSPNQKLDQTSMLQALYKAIHRDLIQSSPVAAQFRLPRGSGLWLTATPSPTRDFLFSNTALIDVVNMRLGIEIFGVGEICGYCHQVMDPMGHHVMGCTR